MPSGLAILDNSGQVSLKRTVVKIYAQVSPIWQWVHLHQISFRVFNLGSFQCQLLFGECPEFALRRFPVVGSHLGPRAYGIRLSVQNRVRFNEIISEYSSNVYRRSMQ
jgi:hypothetical protein